jgi:NADH-quinone oxidoreductase subunit A
MTSLVVALLVFVAVGIAFLLANLALGKMIRPDRPSVAKGEIYECGEKPVGTAWIQFDLRFYVVALLFVIFDVEMAFFFPWAVVFGSAHRAGDTSLPEAERLAAANTIAPGTTAMPDPATMRAFSQFAFAEFLVFFAILLVGFAYLWKRGDLEWVRSLGGQAETPANGK